MAPDLITLVRDKTTDDEEWLSDAKIQMYLEYRSGEWMMAAADCLEYMARDDVYEQYSRGDIRVTKPLLRERARELRAHATYDDGGYVLTAGSITRTDVAAPPDDLEYARAHPPYQYSAGVVRQSKKDAGLAGDS
jgi:hypothetical protein